MSNDSFTDVTSQNWFSRIAQSLKGIIVGLLLVIAAFILLWWNEGRSVQRYKSLQEGPALLSRFKRIMLVRQTTVNLYTLRA